MIVVDASVAAKWFVPEAGEKAAHDILNGRKRLIAPALIRLEVTGAILRHHRKKLMSEPSARAAYGEWKAMLADGTVHLIADAELLDLAWEIAIKCDHKVPDCLYIAAGKTMNAEVITADRPLQERGSKVFRRIKLLDMGTDG